MVKKNIHRNLAEKMKLAGGVRKGTHIGFKEARRRHEEAWRHGGISYLH